MTLTTRMWGAGKLLVLAAGLLVTFLASAFVAARFAVRSREVEVPNLAGQSVAQAAAAVSSLGLTLRVDEKRRPHQTIPAGAILQQEPLAGVRARRQRGVRVWVSDGPRVVRAPALVGRTERTARVQLQQEGLAVGTVAAVYDGSQAADAVIAQAPAAGEPADAVALLVNRGEGGEAVVMPDLIGLESDRASEWLRAYGFRVAIGARQPYPGLPPGIVTRQTPPGGFRARATDALVLEVSQ